MTTESANPTERDQLARERTKDSGAPLQSNDEQLTSELTRHTSSISTAQVIIAAVAVLAVCYVGKTVFVTLMVSILLAFVLEPVVSGLARIRPLRSIGAFIAILLLLAVIYGIIHFSYNRAEDFADQLPMYSQKIRGTLSHVLQKKNRLQQAGENVLPADNPTKQAAPVKIVSNQSGVITRNIGTVTEAALTLVFIPFLVYFMLSWQEHVRKATVQLFPATTRTTAYVAMGQISSMMRSFIAGNFLIGLFMAICSVVAFGFLKLPYFYFLGFISGFVSLIPYLGLILAIFVPLTAGIGTLGTTGVIIAIAVVSGLHLLSVNVLYPKFIGSRLRLNPLVVTIGVLIWGFVWGAVGLILAVPILGAIKIICDHVPNLRTFGAWMGE